MPPDERKLLCIFLPVLLKPPVVETGIVIEDSDTGIGRVRTHISDTAGISPDFIGRAGPDMSPIPCAEGWNCIVIAAWREVPKTLCRGQGPGRRPR
jgi:hypothetical protein